MRPRVAAAFLVAASLAWSASAQDAGAGGDVPAVDEAATLAEAPLAGSAEAPAPAGEGGSAALSALESAQPLSFSGLIEVNAGGAVGWPVGPLHSSFLASTAGVGGFTIDNYLYFDARPEADARVHGALYAAAPAYSLAVSELFLDYSIADAIFLRAGKQSFSWDNTRIFEVGDLLDCLPSDLSLKAYVPFGGSGLTGIAAAHAASASDWSSAVIAYAARLDLAFWKLELSEEAAYNDASNDGALRLASSAKASALGVDFFAEGFCLWKPAADPLLSFVGGGFWESGDPRLKVFAEYWYNGESSFSGDHRCALGLGWTISEAWKLKGAFLGAYAFTDASATFMPYLSWEPAAHVTVSLAAPIGYGETGDVYCGTLLPVVADDMPFAWSKKYSAILRIAYSLSY